MDEYRLIIRVKNNLLHQLMLSKGIETQSALSRVAGICPKAVGDIANLKVGAYNADGTPSYATRKLCDYFGCLPEDIYPKEVLHVGIPKNVIERLVSSEQVAKYITQAESAPEALLEWSLDTEYFKDEIRKLKPRSQRVIIARFYEDKTLYEIGEELGVTPERVRQMLQDSLKLLRASISNDDANHKFWEAE